MMSAIYDAAALKESSRWKDEFVQDKMVYYMKYFENLAQCVLDTYKMDEIPYRNCFNISPPIQKTT